MIHVIMGLKGSGKTKKLIDAIHAAVADAHGDVVCIEYGKKLTYDVSYKVRLCDSQEYGICSPVFIDNLYKTIGQDKAAAEDFVTWCAKFAADNNMEITMTISEDPNTASEAMKQYI